VLHLSVRQDLLNSGANTKFEKEFLRNIKNLKKWRLLKVTDFSAIKAGLVVWPDIYHEIRVMLVSYTVKGTWLFQALESVLFCISVRTAKELAKPRAMKPSYPQHTSQNWSLTCNTDTRADIVGPCVAGTDIAGWPAVMPTKWMQVPKLSEIICNILFATSV